MQEPTLSDAAYNHRVEIQIRFNDVDRFGHVNNNAYFSFYDLGKESYLEKVLHAYSQPTDIVPVVANINANFFKPVFYGDRIVVETRVSHVGTKSFTIDQRATNIVKNTVVASCQTVMVCFSLKTQQAVEVPDALRELIAANDEIAHQ